MLQISKKKRTAARTMEEKMHSSGKKVPIPEIFCTFAAHYIPYQILHHHVSHLSCRSLCHRKC